MPQNDLAITTGRKGIVKSCQSFHSLEHLDSRLKYQMTVTNFFLRLFVNEEIIASLTLQTNKYAAEFLQANDEKLGEHSTFSK